MTRTRKYVVRATAAAVAIVAGAGSAQAQGLLENLSIHGYLTQGYAKSYDNAIYGIPTDGTTDYRSAALQFRYAMTEKDNFVLQLRNFRQGDNLLASAQDDVQVQWAFYQRRLGNASVRIGKLPLPMGFYNEMRDVGTLLPFFRAPSTVYPEGTETFDGVNASYRLPLGAWEFEAGANAGAFTSLHAMRGEGGEVAVSENRSDGYYAGTMTVHTPISGLRARGTLMRFNSESFSQPGAEETTTNKMLSLDGTFDRFFARGEVARLNMGEAMTLDLYYAQAGVKLHPKVGVNVQHEVSKMELTMPGAPVWELTNLEDTAIGVNFYASPNVVLKLEGHDAKGYSFDGVDFMGPPATGKYVISSVSVVF